ncbi:hypothetical protein RhiirA1_429474 [Rhizophagus irregularis]|uniref:Uncharacterized protein n=2 Tax=Rhizophagus irregularis TaxID=588596 RepID=A0A2N0QX47_9GLOM|nr:hypothetical protein RhiirA1_429474 [Rhizophagus irregularis]GBC44334.1 hypothetical protein GLOIN_2v1539319 [Rhizophagus irregularis DAOM 181602=DAOM 197198]
MDVVGFVQDCIDDYLFQKGNMDIFKSSSWVQCIKEFKNNPLVKKFMVKKACFASI